MVPGYFNSSRQFVETDSTAGQDLPEGSVTGTTVRFMYSVGLILTSPLQLFPAVKVKRKRVLLIDRYSP